MRSVISPAPSMLGGRASRPTTCGWSGRSSLASSTRTSRSSRSTSAEQRRQQRGLAGAGAAADEERQPRVDDPAQQLGHLVGDRAGGDQLVEGEARPPRAPAARSRCPAGPPAPARHGTGCRRRAGRRRTAWRRRAAGRRAPASRCASRRTASSSGNAHLGQLEPAAAVEVDPAAPLTRTSVTPGVPQQRLERPGADDVAAQRLVDREHGGVADRPAGVAQRLGDPVRRQLAGIAASRSRTASTSAVGASSQQVVMPRRPRASACVEHGRAARPSGAARRAHRPEPEVDAPRPARAGRASRRPRRHRSPARSAARSRPSPRTHEPQRRDGRGTARTAGPPTPRRPRSAPPRRAAGRSAPPPRRSARRRVRGRSTTTRSWPRWAAESASRTANACRLPRAPAYQVSTPSGPRARQRLAQRPGAEPAGGLAERVPAEPVLRSRPSTRSMPGPERVAVDHDRVAATGPRSGRARRRSVVAPGAAGAADHADHQPAPALGVAEVGERLDQPGLRAGSSATLSAPRARAVRNSSSGTSPQRHDVHAVAARRRRSRATRRPGRRRPGPAARRAQPRRAAAGSCATSGVTPAAAASRSSSSSRSGRG